VAHQARDALAAHPDTLGNQLGVHARRAVSPPRLPMDRRDLRAQLDIGPRPRSSGPPSGMRRRGRRRTSCSGSSRRRGPTSSGSPTSRTSGRGAGFLFLAVVLDVWSRRVVGWAMAAHLRTELVLDALDMAVSRRRPHGVIHHSDQGCQYTSIAFGLRCRQAGVQPSVGSVGDAYDNALCESFFATLDAELLDRHRFATLAHARLAVFDYIEGWYNPRRRHSALGYLAPIIYERSALSLP
jgi:transposase InsO family protein